MEQMRTMLNKLARGTRFRLIYHDVGIPVLAGAVQLLGDAMYHVVCI